MPEPRPDSPPGPLDRLRDRIASSRLWRSAASSRPARAVRSSLSVRAAILVGLVLVVLGTVFALLSSSLLRSSVFESRREQILDDASVRFSAAQSLFDQSTATTTDQVQEAARQTVSSIRSSAAGAGAVSVVLLRSQDPTASLRINQIVDQAMDGVVSDEMRRAVVGSGGAQWQSIAIPASAGSSATEPGILVGMQVRLPRAGAHELYIVYSLASDQSQVDTILSVLAIAAIPVAIGLPVGVSWMLFRLLAPVRRTASAAQEISAGDLSARVPADGSDEMAHLSRAFNDMAASLQSKINEYDELSQLQQRFVSDVSHELRTPLTTIRMADSVIWDNRDSLDGGAKRSAELLHEQTERMESMLADLLEISRYDARSALLDPEVTDLRPLVAKVVDAHVDLAERNRVPVRVRAPRERCAAEIDARRIERVLRNLLVNAVEHADSTPVDIDLGVGPTSVAVRVRDHGVGMTPEVAARVFDRFYRADTSRVRTTGGTGLGLAIATEDVALHGGTLAVRGEPGRGASFLMTLPRVAGAPIEEQPLGLWEED
ncbi:MtrAB system histidine kinase MtrB [Actinomyces sp. B33]|uniref:MtrAB system histidine kinase MtrB n=1 Tax=Actinomyces sp. B33 TaxID=2942131 RepID=UPI0023413A3C|nr:MtrAB system histidine kinase MtrB [Actinomyces sp. B33]MDC4232674.1 MtrAB system histidine kinase MtrB [Actinomyces sp. B33]